MTKEQEDFLKNCDYQMKRFELVKEAVFFQKYSQGYEFSLENDKNLNDISEKERDLEEDG